MADFLATMAAASRRRLQAARSSCGEAELLARCQGLPAAPEMTWEGFGILAEIKRSSPSAGVLAEAADAPETASAYAAAGASAISVLTEPDRFGGSLEDLQSVAETMATPAVPAMRKDFLVDPYQVLEARAAGAGGVLVIVAMLDDPNVADLLACALEQGLFVLLEAFDERDLDRAARLAEGRSGQILMGLNSRDLRSLTVDPGRLERLAPHFPKPWPKVAESGLERPEDAGRMAAAGYDLALVGSALMRSPDPGGLLAGMLEAGRQVRRA